MSNNGVYLFREGNAKMRDLPIGSTDPLGRQVTLSYDTLGQLVTFTDQKAQLGTYTYSNRYELTREQYADGTDSRYAYDALGQLATCLDGTGSYTFTYNARGDLTVVQTPQHPAAGLLTYAYDAVGNRVGLFSWLGPQTMTYDALDRCTSLLFDNASKLTTWLYDGLNRPTMLFHWNGSHTVWAYDAASRAHLIRHGRPVNILLDFATYTYDAASNPLSRWTNTSRATWTYDNAGQLQTEQHTANALTDTCTYDAAGNRTQRARTQSGALTVSTYAYDAAGQLVTILEGTSLTTFAFDSNGNLQSENTAPGGITTYTWDALDRLASVVVPGGMPTTCAYRYDGLRASQNPGSGVQTSVWDVPGPTGFGDLFEELDSSNNLLRAYYRATDLAAQKDASGTYAFYLIDQGTVQLLADAATNITVTYQFGAWGELFASTGTVTAPLSWNGEWGYYRDTSARSWVRARHLDVLRGRWFSSDPAGFRADLNPYGYAYNTPLVFVDASGEIPLGRIYRPVPGSGAARPTLPPAGATPGRPGDTRRSPTGGCGPLGQRLTPRSHVPTSCAFAKRDTIQIRKARKEAGLDIKVKGKRQGHHDIIHGQNKSHRDIVQDPRDTANEQGVPGRQPNPRPADAPARGTDKYPKYSVPSVQSDDVSLGVLVIMVLGGTALLFILGPQQTRSPAGLVPLCGRPGQKPVIY
jgi:RHS repeat-associated protein